MMGWHSVRHKLAMTVWLHLAFAGSTAVAQLFPEADGARRQLSPPQVNRISSTTSARLEQVRALAADKNWAEAIDILQQLTTEDADRLVDLGDGRFVTLRTYCHRQFARLPAEALADYRRRVDPLAERWYRGGLANHDERLLRRVVDELYCSSWGDEALLALGELALERGDYAAARQSWEQISPLLRDPAGRPMWFALRDIDVNANWQQIEHRWHERPKSPTWLAYPDTNLDLADIRARLVLASVRAGNLNRAALELDVFRRLHPQAAGRFGGQEGVYVDALKRLAETAKEWPAIPLDAQWETFGGSPKRSSAAPALGPIRGPVWPAPVEFSAAPIARQEPAPPRVILGPFGLAERGEQPAMDRCYSTMACKFERSISLRARQHSRVGDRQPAKARLTFAIRQRTVCRAKLSPLQMA
jgi:hypothetical protein